MSKLCRRTAQPWILTIAALFAWFDLGAQRVGAQTEAATPADATRKALAALEVFPPGVRLEGPYATQHLLVTGKLRDGRKIDLTREARYRFAKSPIASVDAYGQLHIRADGSDTLIVTARGRQEQISVDARGAQAEPAIAFSRDIVPILTKAGCNQGACHGGHHGKGGFRLSLLGYDAPFDYAQIVQSSEGRRVALVEPEQSLVLLKPSLTLAHGGGKRLPADGPGYNSLRVWLEEGAPPPTAKDATVTGLEVWPPRRQMAPGDQQQLMILASWSDGRKTDATDFVQFDSLNDGLATVDPRGLVTCREHGESHVMIRYGGQAAVMEVASPFGKGKPNEFRSYNFIDDKIAHKWLELGIDHATDCTDAEFLRRVSLDLIGELPTPEEARAFLADTSVDRRARLVDQLMDRPEFVDFWTLKWGDLLRINRNALNEKGMWSFRNWLHDALRDRRPIDAMVRDIITAEGSTFTDGPANFYRTGNSAADWAESTAQVFLGVRMQCARCHHHPFEKWSQADYNGMAAFFARMGTKNSDEFGIFGQERVIYLKPAEANKGPKPHPLDGPEGDDPDDRRRLLADWMTSPSNPFFARNFANRFWGYLMGRGLVEPLDDLRATNPASIPELLDALASDFAKNGYDLRRLLKQIVLSHAYQLSSAAAVSDSHDALNVYYSHYTVKRLTAEQLADALDQVTRTQEKYPGLPAGTKAIQLPDTGVRSLLLDLFGRPPRQVACECERGTQPNIAQALHLLNGDFLTRKIGSKEGRIQKLLDRKAALPCIIDELYLASLCRLPRDEEVVKASDWVRKAPSTREGLQDLMWVLFNSREFLFNH
jgi:hypothetical protein